MAKIYPEDEPRQDISDPQKPAGDYDRPSRKKPSRAMIIVLVIAIVIIVAMFLAGFAHAADSIAGSSLLLLTENKDARRSIGPGR